MTSNMLFTIKKGKLMKILENKEVNDKKTIDMNPTKKSNSAVAVHYREIPFL